VGVEFVSADDCLAMEEKAVFSSVTEYDCKDAARRLAKSVGGSANGLYFATFYDPTAFLPFGEVVEAIGPNASPEEFRQTMQKLQEKAKVEPKRLLREQVRDFVEWLKGQGVI
jgi:nucleoside-diphosphate-sugar epimerase